MKFAHLITLLLALWAPFNAVTAGASMLDCPMTDLAPAQADTCPDHAEVADTSSLGCDHCASCGVHGGLSLPASFKPVAAPLLQSAPDTQVIDQSAPGIPATPFRPPLTA